ncbi:MAG: hypothetical protein U1A78_34810 [Polyangia bacterium]
MPRLLRLRLVSVGHAGARFDDLVLDLRDRAGMPTDSTLWLRNGGGKTSLLSLFFALLRPDKREFLGLKVTGKTEGRPNELKDFILPEDRSVVVSEWELDGGAALFADAEPQRYLTGVFYERRSGADDDLQRLFFAGYAAAQDPALQVDGLPLHTSPERRSRRTLSAFRQEWLALRERHPSLQVTCTDSQREWAQLLDSVGIDTELFAYQLRMNRRESGADELFRFSDHERFIDFLLEVAHTSELGDKLRQNLGTLRRELLERKDRLLPEQELVAGLLERLGPLIELAQERQRQRDAAGLVRADLDALRGYATARLDALSAERDAKLKEQDAARLRAVQAGQEAEAARRRAVGLRLRAAGARRQHAREELQRLEQRREEALRLRHLWDAAGPLRRALDAEQRAEENQRVLRERQQEHTPLREQTEQAAAELAAALDYEAAGLREESDRQSRLAQEEDRLARRASEDKAAARSAQERCRADIARATRALAEVEQRRAQLVAQGALRDGEKTGAARDRLDAARQAAEREGEQQLAAAEHHRREAARLAEEQVPLERSQVEAQLRAQALTRALDEAHQAEREICSSPVLARLFQIEPTEVRLEPLIEQALARLPAELDRIDQQKMQLRTERAEDERACFALERTGLLPPSPEVESALAQLPRAWSGWQFLAENKADNLKRRACVRSAPHLAAGIVVRDADFVHAVETLTRGAARFSVPVVIGSASSLLDAEPGGWQVFGPHSDAYFDRKAGQAEHEERQARIRAIGSELTQLDTLREEAERLRHRLLDFRRRWPPGSRLAAEAEQQAAEQDARALKAQASQIADRVAEHRRLEVCAHKAERAATHSAHQLAATLAQLRAFAEEHEAHVEQHLRAKSEAERAERDHQEQMERAAQAETSHADQAALARERAQAQAVRAQQHADERARITYLVGEVVPQAGPMESLRARYDAFRDLYEQRVGQDSLQRLIERERKEAGEARQELARKLEASRRSRETPRLAVTEEEVEQALRSLPGSVQLEVKQQEASDAYATAHGAKARQDQTVQSAIKEYESAEKQAKVLGVASVEEPWTGDLAAGAHDAEAAADQAEQDAERSASEAVSSEQAARDAGAEAYRLGQRHDALRKDAERVDSLIRSYDDVLADASPKAAGRATAPLSDAAVEEQIGAIDAQLAELRRGLRLLVSRLQEAAQKIRSFAQERRFEPLNSSIARRFAEAKDEHLGPSAARLQEELSTRLKALQEQLAALDKHREFLIDIALEAAREGLKLLSAAAASSRIPPHVLGLGGVPFLTIRESTPQSPTERRARIAQLIDRVLDKEDLPSGLGLVQQAVRELAQPIRARVLNPDPDLERRSVEIPELARFSGGERLTCAVLLYCTLAQLRARTRGAARLPSSVLFLDNPIGASSRVRFLDIQRDVAQAMRIQLVYTTGVNDLDALATLPNVIRLRNERIDRARGHRHVEHAPSSERRVVSTRILLPADPPPATGEAP